MSTTDGDPDLPDLPDLEDSRPDCVACGGTVDPTIPGYHKTPDEQFMHRACYRGGEPKGLVEHPMRGEPPEHLAIPERVVSEVEEELGQPIESVCHFPVLYNCGHTMSAPPRFAPGTCPECDDPMV